MQAFDGVTTALELEAGSWPISLGYQMAARQGRPLNYGFSSSWAMARMTVVGGLKSDGTLATFNRGMAVPGWGRFATAQESEKVLGLVEQGLREGGLGIGVLLGYGPESNIDEYFAVAGWRRDLAFQSSLTFDTRNPSGRRTRWRRIRS